MTRTDYNLEERVVDFAVSICRLIEAADASGRRRYLAGQLFRSSTASAANYAEARSAQSRADFVHKMTICLKELRETKTWLELALRLGWISKAADATRECDELVRIFAKSIETARQRRPSPPD